MDGILFEAKDLYKSFGSKEVLKGVSISAKSGQATGLLGRNGAGKTTTIRIAMGVFPPDSGSVLVDGAPIDRGKLRIGYLPEERGLYAKSLIAEQLLYLARLRGMHTKEAKKSIAYWLEKMGLAEYANKKLEVLSKGNQQKIQLAAALIAKPELIILDEPFSGLDPVNATLLEDVVKEQITEGKMVLFSSHQMNYVEKFCDHIAILHQGRIVLDGEIDEIKRSYDRKKMLVKSRQAEQIVQYCKEKLEDILTLAQMEEGNAYLELKEEKLKNDLLLALAGQRFDLDSVSVFEPSLNDIFVEYTGSEEVAADEAV
ncbi:ATP-binding cassette domain-containing protein [Christensenellaceae bacterium OttesenSCG-928-K19]|nr:ATP-binding cassette domain-containing protein [Christensenellaceae bacterium OttesenSCG-928-K19]